MAAQLSGLRTEKDVFAEAARIGYDTLLLTMFQKNTLGDVKTHGMSLLWPHGTDLDYERAGRTVVIDAGLQAASGAGRLSTVKLLLGEDVRPDHDILFSLLVGLTPLTAAVRNGQKDAAKLLLKHMTKRQRKLQLRHSLDAVIETASLPMVELLVDLGVRVPDEDGETPILRRAVKNGNAEIFALLMKRGAVDETAHPDLQIQDSAVELAAAAGYAATVRLLLGKRRSTVTPRNEQIKALQLAAGNGKDEVVKLFLDHGISDLDDDRLTGWNLSIYTAARAGHATTVDILLQHCRNTDKKKYFFPHTMAFAIETGNVELVQMLLEIGLSVDDILQPFGYTPLQRALVFDRPEVISFLLGLGADSNMEVSKTTAEKSYVVLPAGMLSFFLAVLLSQVPFYVSKWISCGSSTLLELLTC